MHRLIRRAIFVFVVYGLLAYAALFLLNSNPPRAIESLLVVIAMPLNLLTLPWIGPLSAVGLTEGEWIRFPTPLGMLLIILFYATALYLTLWTIASLWRRIVR